MSKYVLKMLVSNLFAININSINLIVESVYKNKIEIKNKSAMVFFGKKKLLNCCLIICKLILNKKNFTKNFFLLYKFKNVVIGNNIYPDWPGIYYKQKFYLNLFLWSKKFFQIIFYYKNLFAIVIKVN